MYINLFRIFFKIGFFTLGGGYAMIPQIESEIVDRRKWMDRKDFLDLIAAVSYTHLTLPTTERV